MAMFIAQEVLDKIFLNQRDLGSGVILAILDGSNSVTIFFGPLSSDSGFSIAQRSD